MVAEPRILCLHGGGSNNDITPFQTMGLKLHERMECIYLHAPHEVPHCYSGLQHFSSGPWYIWANPTTASSDQWEESLECIAAYIRENGPFDAVYGFSQGTAIITHFSHPKVWKEKFNMDSCPWKFAILACGGASHQIDLPKGATIDVPSFHIYGKRDGIIGDSKRIAEYWDKSKMVTHTHGRGHEIDSQMFAREKEMMAKLSKFVDEHLLGQAAKDSAMKEEAVRDKGVERGKAYSAVGALLSSIPTPQNWMNHKLGNVES